MKRHKKENSSAKSAWIALWAIVLVLVSGGAFAQTSSTLETAFTSGTEDVSGAPADLSPIAEDPAPISTPSTDTDMVSPNPYVHNAFPAPSAPATPDRSGANPASEDSLNIGKYFKYGLYAVALAVILLLVFWGRAVAIRVMRLQKYAQAAMLEEQPSLEERFQGELATLPVSLLRGSLTGYYEKIFSLLRRILIAKGLLTDIEADGRRLMDSLQNAGADAAYIDSVASIVSRCDAVCLNDEKPPREAHEKIAKDLGVLLKMNPHVIHSRTESPDPEKLKKKKQNQ
jgi:hypothetical protein